MVPRQFLTRVGWETHEHLSNLEQEDHDVVGALRRMQDEMAEDLDFDIMDVSYALVSLCELCCRFEYNDWRTGRKP